MLIPAKEITQHFLSSFAHFFPMRWLIQLTGQKLFLPFYHSIEGKNPLPHIHHLYTPRTEKQFEKDLDFLLKNFHPVSLEVIFEAVKNQQPLAQNSFHLSFDDGLREVYNIVFPILKKKGIPATIFLNSAFVDNRDLFFRYKASLIIEVLEQKKSPQKFSKKEILNISFQNKNQLDDIAKTLEIDFLDFLKKEKPYLTSAQIRAMQREGFTFGGHSVDHPFFEKILLDEQLKQTSESINFVQKHFPEKIKSFAFPFTDFQVSKDFFQKIEAKNIADITFGTAGLKQENFAFHLQRFPMELTTLPACRVIAAEYFYYIVKSFFGKNKMKRP